MLPCIQQIMAGINKPPVDATISWTYSSQDENNLSSYTFNTASVGTAATGRYIVLMVTASANSNFGTITGATMNGNAMTQIDQIEDASGFSCFAMFGGVLNSGTTADFVISLSGSPDRLGIDVAAMYDLLSTTPTYSQTFNTATTNPQTVSMNVQAGGVCLAFAGSENNNATSTWSGLTERSDHNTGGGGGGMSAACDAFSTAQTGLSVSHTWSAGQSRQGLIAKAWR